MAVVSGPVAFDVDGESYSVAFTVNALCALEEEFGGRSISDIGDNIASGSAGARGVRALFRASLLDAHPQISDRDAGRLLDALGAQAAGDIIQQAFARVQAGLQDIAGELPPVDKQGRLIFEVAGERIMLVFGFNAQAELEDYFGGLKPEEIARKVGAREITLRDLRAMFRASAIDDRELTIAAAGRLIDRIGLKVAGRAVAVAFVGAFPEAATEMEGEPEGNRRQRRAAAARPTKRPKGGTGKR